MNPKSFVTILAMTIIISLVSACSMFGEEPEPEPVVVDPVQQSRVVSAEAFVVPIREADLAFELGGRVVSTEVEEGDEVKQGDILARVEDSTQQAQLTEAEANLVQAGTNLSQAEANLVQAEANLSRAEAELAARVSSLAEAEANLALFVADPTEEKIAQLQANLARAEAVLAELLAGSTPEDVAQAEAQVQTARAQLNEVLADARDEDLQAAAARLLKTEADVREAQSEYDKVRYGDPDVVLGVGVVLEKATLDYEAAQAEYDKLINGATDEAIATAQARVAEAEAALAKVLAGATAEQIAQAQADVARAEADLANLLAGYTDEEIAIAEAQVETSKVRVEEARVMIEEAEAGIEGAEASIEGAEAGIEGAEAGVGSAQVELDKTELAAPYDGLISNLEINEGEVVQAGASVISLGDTSIWQIETDDLTEIDIVDVQLGAKVQISVDALPGETMEGKVVRITPKSETKAGDVTYTVLIDITRGDTSRLRWGMTTFVDIEADAGLAR
jgi:HlyD family secretion protein